MQRILSGLRRACDQYNLIENGDKIAVGVSGGKDSLVLLKALKMFSKFSPKKFDLIGVSVDMFGGKSDYSKIANWCKENDIEYHVINSDIYQIVFEERKEKSPCSLCSKLRRGILASEIKKLGCNKLALGHTMNDVIDTFLLSLIYEGRLSTIKPKAFMSRTQITVIRPLILIDEKDISGEAKSLPVMKSLCPVDKHTQREFVRNMVNNVNKEVPNSKKRIFSAIINPDRYNLFDK